MEQNDVRGVFRLANGNWAYRINTTINGQKVSKRKVKDENGNILTTQKKAMRAREKALIELRKSAESSNTSTEKKERRTVREVYEEFCENGRKDRAYQTKRKQDSLWRIHLNERFGSRYVDSISVAEINDYLAELYYRDL